ncbi:long-chain-fatty-acid-CoA ligase [Geomicrobium sp. JCM 19039]|nr:long-chain-fatty-acid-CoA ligase [Geomicrobium sp. JCM 19039]
MVPTMYQRFIQEVDFERANFPSMKSFLSGGAPCPNTVYEAFERRGLPFREGYGMTEAGPNNFYISNERSRKKVWKCRKSDDV